MAPKLASCNVFGMLLKYGVLTEGGFGGGEKPILAGVLVSGIGLLSLLVSMSGGHMTHCWEEFVLCDACCAVCWLPCCVCCCSEPGTVCCMGCCCCCMGCCSAVVWDAAAAVVWGALTACLGYAVAPVHVTV